MLGVCRLVFLNPDPISDQKVSFPHPFSDLALGQKLCHNRNVLTAAFNLACLEIRSRNEEAINSTRNRNYWLKVFYFLLYRRWVFFRIFTFYLFLNWFTTRVSDDQNYVCGRKALPSPAFLCHKYKEKRLADYESQKKNANKTISSNAFRIRIFLFFSYSFGIEVTNTSIRPPSSLENDTLLQKWVKCIPVFRPKRPKNHTL